MKLFVAFFAIVAVVAAEVSNEYLPPGQEVSGVVGGEVAIGGGEVAFGGGVESAALADDGYRYKTVRRLKYRHRRDVNELPSNEYLPPQDAGVGGGEVAFAGSDESAALADDGYRYKTVRRLKYRHRRDVNELPSNEYLPPQDAGIGGGEVAFAGSDESAALADDGYRYKTVRRLKYRHRRDVNELPSNEYLPPQDAGVGGGEVAFAGSDESAALADDGYRYKTVRRLKYRHRRDVNELPSNEYLPPQDAGVGGEVAFAGSDESAALADDGYRYKTVRRLKYRHRRDVNELPSNEYLPPQDAGVVGGEVAIGGGVESAALADDGYRYKTVRRLRYRHRRDVNELPSNEYLPPQDAGVGGEVAFAGSDESGALADDGYRYKTVRRLRYRHRRDVNELPSNEYLPPQDAGIGGGEVAFAGSDESGALADDGYRYKTVRRLKYRHRRV